MPWDTDMTEMVRVLLGDTSEDESQQVYADESLRRLLVVAAFQVSREMTFSRTFDVDITDQDITPDPTDDDEGDDSFVNLTCLKAACIADRGSASRAHGMLVKDGPITFDSRDDMKGKIALLEKGWCAVYDDAKQEYMAGQTRVAGAAILTPFRLYADNRYRFFPDRDTRQRRFF